MVANDAPDKLLPPMAWNAWGDPSGAKPLSDGIRKLLEHALGVSPSDEVTLAIEDVKVAPSTLTDIHRDGLIAIVGADYFKDSDQDRILRAGGKSTLDLLRRKRIDQEAPDAVLLPTVSNKPRTTPSEIRDYFVHFMAGKPSGSIDHSYIKIGCNTVQNVGTYTFKFANGKVVHARYTYVYQWENGKWLIVHHHSSAMPQKH